MDVFWVVILLFYFLKKKFGLTHIVLKTLISFCFKALSFRQEINFLAILLFIHVTCFPLDRQSLSKTIKTFDLPISYLIQVYVKQVPNHLFSLSWNKMNLVCLMFHDYLVREKPVANLNQVLVYHVK